MQRVLLIKLTSLGDLIHALPALSDAQDALPGIEFDWVIDEGFQEIALLHPAVKGVITTWSPSSTAGVICGARVAL